MYESIYVYCPRGLRTGGPEALHQLVDSLNRQGQSAFLVPVPGTESFPRVDEYCTYVAPEAASPVDAPRNAIVLPESAVPRLPRIRTSTTYRWWLSVNNSPKDFLGVRRKELKTGLTGYPRLGALLPVAAVALYCSAARERSRISTPIHHLTQSQYAWSHVYEQSRVPPTMLGDYIPSPSRELNILHRSPVRVAYNPRKSGALAERVAALMPDLEFFPIQNMTRTEVDAALMSCAAYLDLGCHPGKDRLPREAARAEAIVIVAMRGSAAYFTDVPIPRRHKVWSDDRIVASAVEALRGAMADPEAARRSQDPYREHIEREKHAFDSQVRNIFIDGVRGLDSAGDYHRVFKEAGH